MEKRIFTHVEWWRGAGTKEISSHLTTHTPWDILEHENIRSANKHSTPGPSRQNIYQRTRNFEKIVKKLLLVSCYTEGTIELTLPGCVYTLCIEQCCGGGTGTVGTLTFCLRGTGMQYGSSSDSGSGSVTGFWSGSNINVIKRKQEIKYERPTFLEIGCFWHWKGKILCNFSFLENCAKYCLDPEPKPEPKLSQSRNWNRNKSLRSTTQVQYANW